MLKQFLTCVHICNDANLRQDEAGHWMIDGDPTDGCFLTLVRKSDLNVPTYKVISKIPFDSNYKYMAVLAEIEQDHYLFVKGAPDRVFEMVQKMRPRALI